MSDTNTEASKRLEILDLGSKGVAKTTSLISCTVTTQLICAFVFLFNFAKKQIFS